MPEFKRWYDHDPVLLEVVELLRNYQDELRAQAKVFLAKIEEKVSKETIDKFYDMVKPINGNRWYDKDPIISKTVELLSNNYLLNEAANISDENMEKGYFVKNIGEKIKLYDKIWAYIKYLIFLYNFI